MSSEVISTARYSAADANTNSNESNIGMTCRGNEVGVDVGDAKMLPGDIVVVVVEVNQLKRNQYKCYP